VWWLLPLVQMAVEPLGQARLGIVVIRLRGTLRPELVGLVIVVIRLGGTLRPELVGLVILVIRLGCTLRPQPQGGGAAGADGHHTSLRDVAEGERHGHAQ
jgi:hypothetical protein